MQNAINWFEIPTTDLDRAARFYNTIFNIDLRREDFAGVPHAYFPADERAIGGALVLDPRNVPSSSGSRVYLNVQDSGNLNAVMGRVEAAGGQTIVPPMSIGDVGWMGIIVDTEGNVVGLHAPA